jgi:hypothetical protein
MHSSDTHTSGLRLASHILAQGACLVLFAACSAGGVDDYESGPPGLDEDGTFGSSEGFYDEQLSDEELGSVEQAASIARSSEWSSGHTIVSAAYTHVRCLDVAGANRNPGTNVRQWGCNGTSAQNFTPFRFAGGGAGYRFHVFGTGLCLDVAGASKQNGANVQIWICNGSPAQEFYMIYAGSGNFYYMMNVNSGKCLDLNDGLNPEAPWGGNLQQWDCHWGQNQKFWVELP